MKIYNSHSQPVLSISLFFQNNNNFDQSDLFLSKKHNIDWEALFSVSSSAVSLVSSEVSNDWLPFSCVVYNLQSVQADKSFSSNELLNSRRERYNRRRDCFSAETSHLSLWHVQYFGLAPHMFHSIHITSSEKSILL